MLFDIIILGLFEFKICPFSQVQHEVLMTVARGPPHYLLHNGVGLDDVEHMAKALLDNLVKQRGSVDFTVLSHLHNLLPFADDRILQADPKVLCLVWLGKLCVCGRSRKFGSKKKKNRL